VVAVHQGRGAVPPQYTRGVQQGGRLHVRWGQEQSKWIIGGSYLANITIGCGGGLCAPPWKQCRMGDWKAACSVCGRWARQAWRLQRKCLRRPLGNHRPPYGDDGNHWNGKHHAGVKHTSCQTSCEHGCCVNDQASGQGPDKHQ
jgi:hypothetical protein